MAKLAGAFASVDWMKLEVMRVRLARVGLELEVPSGTGTHDPLMCLLGWALHGSGLEQMGFTSRDDMPDTTLSVPTKRWLFYHCGLKILQYP